MTIDLDSITFDDDEQPESVGDQRLPGSEIPQGMSLESILDRMQRMLFLIDKSTSMDDKMEAGDIDEVYDWPKGLVEKTRNKMIEVFEETKKSYEGGLYKPLVGEWGVLGIFSGNEGYTQEQLYVCAHWGVDVYDDMILKNLIVTGNLEHQLDIRSPEVKEKYANNQQTKLSIVQQAAKSIVEARYKKYPEATVTVMTFNDSAQLIADSKPLKETLAAIAAIRTQGCTRIKLAVEMAIKQFKKSPSEVKLHHLILVSDAEDASAKDVKELVPLMKKQGIVFDFILIRGAKEFVSRHGRNEVASLIEICSETGGEFKEVRTATDLNAMFLNAVNRKLLPANFDK